MEAAILAGLSYPVPLIAFEYLPASLDNARACVERLTALGNYRFNRIEGEDHAFVHGQWLDDAGMLADLDGTRDSGQSGDVYARLDGRKTSTAAPGKAPASDIAP